MTPIGDYGLLGDTRTAALVSSQGSIDWLCLPRFDGDPIFGRLVGGESAGVFRVGPKDTAPVLSRQYRPHTATIETTWAAGEHRLTLTDAMVAELGGRMLPSTLLVRQLSADGGPVDVAVEFAPRRGERHREPRIRREDGVVVCSWRSLAVSLASQPSIELEVGRLQVVTVTPETPVTFVMGVADREPLVHVDPAAAAALVAADELFWQEWASEVHHTVPQREMVIRSLLTLRLLTYSPSGAPVAAPTTSLPEHIGGERNWDYRYAWPRDASIGVGAFLGVGKIEEARRFLAWLLHASRLSRPELPVLLDLDGRRAPAEHDLRGWPGYRDSRPVRVGNDAIHQHQLDGYGWVVDAAWDLVDAGHPLYSETWRSMRSYADLVAKRWHEPDAGIWETRGPPAHHVHSKVMGWMTLDRALRIADSRPVRDRQRRRWEAARDALAREVRDKGFDAARGTYTRTYGSADTDAALLILPLIGLEEPGSQRTRGTVDAIRSDLAAGGPLLYRYPPETDGLRGKEGAFLACSFWLVQALALTGRPHEAEQVLQQLIHLANPLGLYAEEIDPPTGEHLGNFPQALSHATLVQAALALRDAHADGEVGAVSAR